ncbi:MAG: TetM/TetW/TetO/TetS family tetracycline resistance ribosomal protection protein [Eubacteriales bacterium]|nr:TetM/TetW/TetO/TetS family tetracycline resistance ribosomal protection protein [Eubacteriales bacterium]
MKTDDKRTEYICLGLLAHVDAGKTTLSEAILHRTGAIRSAGRVDHGDAFLDTDAMERDRGITIFSKQASFTTYPAKRLPGAGNARACETPGKSGEPEKPGKSGKPEKSETPGKPVKPGKAGMSAETESAAAAPAAERVWTLVDTPGHADFSTEMERVLQVLDYAVLIISAADGVTGQVRTLWRLLGHYGVPAFLFVNKMDQPGADRDAVYAEIRTELGSACVDLQEAVKNICGKRAAGPDGVSGRETAQERAFAADQPLTAELQEEIAVCDDALMERFLEGEEITLGDAAALTGTRKLFPVCFGSALREEGVDDLLALLDLLAEEPPRGADFGARVYKITHDGSGARLTWLKVTGGTLLPRQLIPESVDEKGQPEKASQLRFYKGVKYDALQEAPAGIIVAVPGLSSTRAGQGLGAEADAAEAEHLLQPVMQSRLILPPGQDLYAAYKKLRALEEEDPMLRLAYDEEKKEITVQVMGQVQREILQRLIEERFAMRVSFGEPRIIYKETIAGAAEGVGHFEPLRHYAEVHLLLEPGEPGSGLVFESRCSVNDLALNWQRLILTHLEERRHKGVLTGAEITDMRISILGGRAHAKHTEGGDFRKATYRAVRQGLMMAQSVLLEPDYEFCLEVPQENIGRAMSDLQQMGAEFGQPEIAGGVAGSGADALSGFAGGTTTGSGAGSGTLTGRPGGSTPMAVLRGTVTVAALGSYVEEVAAYTRGAGSLQCSLRGYVPCKNAAAVIAAAAYDPELDTRNPSSSVFCSHGAGTIVPWYEVRSFMHVDTGWRFPDEAPAMTEEESLDLAAERARKAALEREKQKRLLEEGGFPSPGRQTGAGREPEADRYTENGTDPENGKNLRSAAFQDRKNAGGHGGAAPAAQRRDDAFKRCQQAVFAAEKELMQIFERTYGPVKPRAGARGSIFDDPESAGGRKKKEGSRGTTGTADAAGTGRSGSRRPARQQDHYLLVDGYNIIFAWENLRELALSDIKSARDKLMDILSNFAGFREEKVILVFDAYKVPGGRGEVLRWHNIDVVFTREAETADLYIEKTAHDLAKKYRVTVATSDAVEQVIIFGAGAFRMSAKMLLEEILFTESEMRERYGIGTDE